jgi:C4-dicarboxylate-specific signal transduction histidine kinase
MTINRLNEGLEHKVRERTSQLEQAITSLQETQAQLMQSEKLATIGTLAGGVAHELNNPLAAILANVQLLRLDAEDEDTLESLALIESGAKRCKHIVENLLNYARQSAPEYRSFSVNDVMRDTLDLLQHQLRHADIDLVLELGDVAPVIGVATELGQVFTNLVVNALDALAERPRRGKLAIRSQLAGKLVVVEVQDDGGGIEEHVLNRIFDPFFTTKQVGKGTGLGLSVSQQIAVNFGGRIEAASRPGDGSTFRVVLPAASAS